MNYEKKKRKRKVNDKETIQPKPGKKQTKNNSVAEKTGINKEN